MMPQGLQCLDESGRVVLEVTDRLTRFVAAIDVPAGASGSVQLPEGTAWVSVINNNSPAVRGSAYRPSVTVDGNNVLSYGTNTAYGTGVTNCTLLVGVY
ncbi:hypothetical protein [Luteimonas sp. FCS-9]|uniref:hypothetical protein n=1 Tax=Luteimonas sp. FCS-9 TaxID=1547516 RepID=UPI0012DFF14C|nr:hypothetical protein [Luteimonas sp. FCS-9]